MTLNFIFLYYVICVPNISPEYFRQIFLMNIFCDFLTKNYYYIILQLSLSIVNVWQIFQLTCSVILLALCRADMHLLLHVVTHSLFSNNFLQCGGLLCQLVLGSPKALTL